MLPEASSSGVVGFCLLQVSGFLRTVLRCVNSEWVGEQVERIYLVAIREPDDIAEVSLNLDDVFILDRNTRDIKRGQIIWNENITAETDPTTLTLRIR